MITQRDLLKKIIKIKSLFILNKEKRKEYRQIEYQKEVLKLKNPKFGVSYSIFDGEELLEASIKQIRGCVDYINVVYQLKSWYGDKANENLLPLLNNLKNKGLIDELIEFKPDFSLEAWQNETNKRNLGLSAAKAYTFPGGGG